MSDNKLFAIAWIAVATTVSVIALSTSHWATTTAGKDVDATYAARIKACVNAGGSYIGSGECVRLECK